MHIALVIPFMAPGGVETVLLRLGRFFSARGHAVTVVATDQEGEWWDLVAESGLNRLHLAPDGALSRVGQALRVGKHLAKGGYDVVLMNHDLFAQASLKMLPDRVIAIPILHNDTEAVYSVGLRNSTAWNAAVGVSPKICSVARGLIGNRPVVEIDNGVDVPAKEMLNKRSIPKDRVKLLFAGRIVHSHKGVFFLPGILKGCLERGINATLTVVGAGPDLDDLKMKMREAGLQDKVAYRGRISPHAMYDVMIEHQIFLMPSLFEGLPVVALEAQACGCVPITSRLPGITDKAIQEGQTGFLVDVGDLNGFVDAIERLYRDVRLWSDMSGKAYVRIAKEFSVEAMGSAYLRVIEDCLTGLFALPKNGRRGLWWDRSFFTWKDYVPDAVRGLKKVLLHRQVTTCV